MLSKTQILAGVGLLLIGATILTISLKQRYPKRIPLVPPQRFRAWWFIVAGLVAANILGSNPKLGALPQLIGFGVLSLLATRQFLAHLKTPPTRHTKLVCYLAVLLQYYWIYVHWYGFFVVFIPVFMFLYLPVSGSFRKGADSPLMEAAALHWVLMTAVFCLSHAAFLLIFPHGRGLLFFVVLITEVADAARMLLARNELGRKYSPFFSSATAIAVAWVVAPAFTPLTPEHTVLAGLVLGVAGSIGNGNLSRISEEMGIERGGPLERIESLAYTAPIFLHGYRYFDYPIAGG
jgi:phosphatidate cytidylyltransferase